MFILGPWYFIKIFLTQSDGIVKAAAIISGRHSTFISFPNWIWALSQLRVIVPEPRHILQLFSSTLINLFSTAFQRVLGLSDLWSFRWSQLTCILTSNCPGEPFLPGFPRTVLVPGIPALNTFINSNFCIQIASSYLNFQETFGSTYPSQAPFMAAQSPLWFFIMNNLCV